MNNFKDKLFHEKKMEREFGKITKEINIMDNGKKINFMDTEFLNEKE